MNIWNINDKELVMESFGYYIYTDEVIPEPMIYEATIVLSEIPEPKEQYMITYNGEWCENEKPIPDLTEFTEEELFQFSTLNTLDIERVMKGQTAIKTFMEK